MLTKTDKKLFAAYGIMFTVILSLCWSSNTLEQKFMEQFFNGLKIAGGIYLTILLCKNWININSISRVSFFYFNILVALLALFNAYRTIVLGLGISFTFNLAFHLAVIILYLGQYAIIRERSWKKVA